MNRREFLAGGTATGVTVGMAGCLSRLPFVGGDEENEDDSSEENNEDAGESTDGESSEDDPTDTETQQDDESDAQERDEDEGEQEQEQEQEEEQEQERPEGDGQPDEEDYDVDDEDFESEPAEKRDVEELGADAITIDASATQGEQGTVTITGSVTNDADQTLTADLDILCYDGNDEYIGATLITVQGIPPGDSKEINAEIGPDELQGELEYIRVEPTVYASE